MNVDELSIEQLLVERWIDVQSVALYLSDKKMNPVKKQAMQNSFIMDKKYSASNLNNLKLSYGETNSNLNQDDNYSQNTSDNEENVDQEPFNVRFF